MTTRDPRARARALQRFSLLLAAALALSCAAGGEPSGAASGGGAASATLVLPQATIDAAWSQAQTVSSDMYSSNRSASYAMFHDVAVSNNWWDWSQDSLSYMNGVVPSTSDFESRLGIRELRLMDGPVTCGAYQQGCTIFPAPIAVASTWDVDQAVALYTAQGGEKKAKGANVSLGPVMNIVRDPRGGRNFETFSEDPYLSAQLAAAAVTGIQANHIIATAKHYIDNDTETNRNSIIVNVDERTQHEIYLAPFKAAVQAGTGAVMCAYNQIAYPTGGQDYACENSHTLKDLLKGELAFRGFVMSDWGATHSGAKAANNGLDMEMNTTTYFGNLDGQISNTTAQDMLRRIVFAHLVTGLNANPVTKITKSQGVQTKVVSTTANQQLAQATAEQAIVLLKNSGVLPLSKTSTNIAVFGECADSKYTFQGGGSASGDVTGKTIVTPRQAIANALGISSGSIPYGTESNISGAVSMATGKAAAIVVLCQMSQEGNDRGGINFGASYSSSNSSSDTLVSQIAATGTPTIVMTIGPAQVGMPWASTANVKAILWAGLLGETEGPAIARVLFGDVNPSGKLPVTFGVNLSDFPTLSSVYGNPSDMFPGGSSIYYKEALDVGYRHFDARNITPLFPFGHGLSYTTFGYANLAVTSSVNAQAGDSVTVQLDLTNTGARAGAEVVQVYLGFPAAAGEPPKVLKGFQKVSLAAGASQHVSITLGPDAYQYWSSGWVPALGTFQVMVGSSSRDIRLTGSFTVSNGTPVTYPLTVTTAGTGSGAIASSPSGISCGATCSASFSSGTLVTLTATPGSGSIFSGWSGACAAAGAAATCTVTMSAAQTAGATFNTAPPPVTLAVAFSGAGGGRVISSPSGIDCPTTCTASFPAGTAVTLTATPATGSAFGGWSGACTGTGTCPLSLTTSASVTAAFTTVPTYALTVSTGGAPAGGTVSSTPAGISCGSTCTATYSAGTIVTLTATPNASSIFAGWSGACSSVAATCAVTMSAAQSVMATFAVAPASQLLSQGKTATASSVESSSYPASYAVDASTTTRWSSQFSDPQWLQVDLGQTASITQVILRWEAAYGKAFQIQVSNDAATWTSIYSTTTGTGGTQTLSVTGSGRYVRMYGTARGTAYGYSLYDFQVWGSVGTVNPTLTVSKLGTGAGTVTSTPAGVSCGATCAATFTAGTLVTLTAAADSTSGSTFAGWGGACSGTALTCALTLSASQTVTATFTAPTYPLSVTMAGVAGGLVTSSSGGISCGSVCSASYAANTVVTLTATSTASAVFIGWSGACAGTSSTCALTMSVGRTVTASWAAPTTYPLTVTLAGTGTGTVTSSSGGISCGTTCSASYSPGAIVTLTASSASSSSTFAGWSGACTGSAATCSLTMSAAQAVTATFTATVVTTPCANPVTFANQSGNFNTTGAICLRTAATVNGWGCSNLDGRTVSVNGGTATSTCGAGPFPLAKWSDGYTYFSVTAGTYPWASLYSW